MYKALRKAGTVDDWVFGHSTVQPLRTWKNGKLEIRHPTMFQTYLPEGTANDEQAQTSMKIILRRAANPALRLDKVNNTTKTALGDIENNKGQSPFLSKEGHSPSSPVPITRISHLMSRTKVLFAFLLDDVDSQCESDGNENTSEQPLEDPVRREPKSPGDPSPGQTNEDSTEGEDEEECDSHNNSVGQKHPLVVREGHLIVIRAAVTKGELHSALVIVLDDGTART